MVELEEKIKQAESLAHNRDFLGASFYYKDALDLARNIGDSKKIKILKQKLVEMNKKAQSQMHSLSVEQPIPAEHIEQIDKFIKIILNQKELETQLKIIGAHPNFYPKYDNVEKSSKNSTPLFAVLASNSVFSDEGHLVKGGDDGTYSWFMQMYGISQDIINKLYLLKIFKLMIDDNSLTTQSLTDFFISRRIFTENQIKLLEKAVERFLAEDYISALHILVPQFENSFLTLSEKLGIDIIALNQAKAISTQTKTLSVKHLESEEFQKVWGKDLCMQIKYLLFDPLGYKLRHLVAHGEIPANACNFTTSSMLLYLFLVLAARVESKPESAVNA